MSRSFVIIPSGVATFFGVAFLIARGHHQPELDRSIYAPTETHPLLVTTPRGISCSLVYESASSSRLLCGPDAGTPDDVEKKP